MKLRSCVVPAIIAASTMCLCAAGASADTPYRNWTGSYAGVNAGYGWNTSSVGLSDPTTNIIGNTVLGVVFLSNINPHTDQFSQTLDATGFVGGGQVGYNWQISRNWLIGFETDLQFSGIDGDSSTTGVFPAGQTPPQFRLTAEEQLKWFGTVRARLGFVIDRFMIFGTGGLAYGRTDAAARISQLGGGGATAFGGFGGTSLLCQADAVCLAGSGSQTSIGRAAGFGFEWALWQNMTFKAEYLHIDLGDQTVRMTAQSPGTGSGVVDAKFGNAFDTIRAGLNVRF